jgi:outer membrane protein assembly factor BamB
MSSSSPRWWPAIAIALVSGLMLGWVWFGGGDRTGQDRTLQTVGITLVSLILLTVWLLAFSRLPGRTRLRAFAAVVVLLALGAGAVRIRGVTGDLVPILEWRWSRAAAPALDLPTQPAAQPSAPANVPVAPTPAPAAPAAAEAAAAPLSNPPVAPGEYPQYLGPDRDGTVRGIRLARDWQAQPPKQVWRKRVGPGWSGFAVAQGLAITQEQRGGKEMVVAYTLADGTPRWAHGDDAHYESTVAGEGPRATPTISRGRVFTLGSTGILNAIDLTTGRSIWRRDIGVDNDAPQPDWGRSSSPLAIDDLIVVSAGGRNGRSLVAYHRETGEPAWQGGDDAASYSSPHVATLAGVRQVLMLNQSTIFAHDPATGRVLWRHDWPRVQPTVAQPLVLAGNRVLFSAGYGVGSRLLEIARDASGGLASTLVWESTRLKAKFTNLVLHGGFVYGLDDGVLVCLDPATGERRWKAGRYGHGQVILAENLVVVQTEDGEVVLVDPSPDEHRELTRFRVFDQKTWNPPALAGRFLLVRNDSEAAMLELGADK